MGPFANRKRLFICFLEANFVLATKGDISNGVGENVKSVGKKRAGMKSLPSQAGKPLSPCSIRGYSPGLGKGGSTTFLATKTLPVRTYSTYS